MSEYIVRMPSDMPYEIKAELNAWYVESEPIVRCRDCKHYDVDGHGHGWCIWKYRTDWQVEPDGFCKWGEREVVGE